MEDFGRKRAEIFLWNPQLLGAEGRSRRRAIHVCGALKLYSIEVQYLINLILYLFTTLLLQFAKVAVHFQMVKLCCSLLLDKTFALCWGSRIRPHPHRFSKIAGIALFFFTDMKKEKNFLKKNIFFSFVQLLQSRGCVMGEALCKMTKTFCGGKLKS